jgi:translation initiation factor IF-1
VIEALANGTYKVELSNGHKVLAFFGRKDRVNAEKIAPGNRVQLEMSLYDLSEGRIVLESEV